MIATGQTHRHDDPVFVVFELSSITCFLAGKEALCRKTYLSIGSVFQKADDRWRADLQAIEPPTN